VFTYESVFPSASADWHWPRPRPGAVRTPALLADFQSRLQAQGVELSWPDVTGY